METYFKNYESFDEKPYQIELLKVCPNCGVGNNPDTWLVSHATGEVKVFKHRCPLCNKDHLTTQILKQNNFCEIVMSFPKPTIEPLDDIFFEHAPRFSELYTQAQYAETMKLYDIAAIGYRGAIECLIKDYALDFEIDSKDTIEKMNFDNVISRYLKEDELLSNTAHAVRLLGNDYAHWNKVNDIPFETLKYTTEITIKAFLMKFNQKYPPIKPNQKL
ncbi:DUF4145 domain-containing protein [Streptococcus thoraltensis]|uniref:DUF4145 domain-containing protein n=1 Tax=Streptococcus thoraltensis TaxID=55085 RepID=UPI001F594F52|nr:DUF4145 domain-containing protein [Streptococcus thoraltensis]